MHKLANLLRYNSFLRTAIFAAKLRVMLKRYLISLSFKWTVELVGTHKKLYLNTLLFVLIGAIALFSSFSHKPIVAIFGGIFPIILNICLYHFFVVTINKAVLLQKIPPISTHNLWLFMLLDSIFIAIFCILVLIDVLSSPIFTAIACPIIPILQLYMLRFMAIYYAS